MAYDSVTPVPIQRLIWEIDYPCYKEELIEQAYEQRLDTQTIRILLELPNQLYNTPYDIAEALGRIE